VFCFTLLVTKLAFSWIRTLIFFVARPQAKRAQRRAVRLQEEFEDLEPEGYCDTVLAEREGVGAD
jgi:hypothetical protein